MTNKQRTATMVPLAAFALLACLFLWQVSLGGRAFVPAEFLRHLAPWSSHSLPQDLHAWNPLMYDSVGQFFPWHSFTAQTIKSGSLPLWNPYQFCGTPFIANSQSAPLYPGNLLYWIMPTAMATGWTAILHLALTAWLMWLLLRELGISRQGAVLGAIAWAFSTWQVSWLHLPSFLATSCWLPLALLCTLRLYHKPTCQRAAGLGFAVGMTLLGGHLQVAFYALLATGLFALWQCVVLSKAKGAANALPSCGWWLAGITLGVLLSMPQVLPTLELSRMSHRIGAPSSQGYDAYTNYAVSANTLVTLLLPDFYGNPSNPDSPYFGTSRGGQYFNYAEGALYVGIPTLLLAGVALPGMRRSQHGSFFVALGLLSLLMALGTAVDALFYFGVPGFAQSGSPGRVLVLWALCMAVLAAFGYDRLTASGMAGNNAKHLYAGLATTIAVGGLFGALAYSSLNLPTDAAWQPQLVRQGSLLVLGVGAIIALLRRRSPLGAGYLLIGLLVVDLFSNGAGYNPSSEVKDVYPQTEGVRALQAAAGHDRVMPVNTNWSFGGPTAVFPPNGATVFALRDVQGYDSLFLGSYKAFLASQLNQDPSPPEVGNMVFAKEANLQLAARVGARAIVSMRPLTLPMAHETYIDGIYIYNLANTSGRACFRAANGALTPVEWRQDDPTRIGMAVNAPTPGDLVLSDAYYPGWQASVDGHTTAIDVEDGVFRKVPLAAGYHQVSFRYAPYAFRLGLYLALFAAALMAACGTALLCRKTITNN